MRTLNYCPITDLPITSNLIDGHFPYIINVNEVRLRISLPSSCINWPKDEFFKSNKHIIAGLLFNGQLIEFNLEMYSILNLDDLKRLVREGSYPRTPREKYDYLFLKLFAEQEFDGQSVETFNINRIDSELFYQKLFFKTDSEMVFYAQSLDEDSLIAGEFLKTLGDSLFTSYRITYQGLSHALEITSEGKNSKNCFIAMSFGDGMGEIRQAIKDACNATGYSPILIDEVHHDSDTTINDAIIANLKKSRFCIADFTEQKKGVYFESGFALGQGKQVIYSCRKDSFNESHFDTNHFPHILYNTPDELKSSLINKIEAWIR